MTIKCWQLIDESEDHVESEDDVIYQGIGNFDNIRITFMKDTDTFGFSIVDKDYNILASTILTRIRVLSIIDTLKEF